MIRKLSPARIVAIALGGLIVVLALSFSVSAQVGSPENSIAFRKGTKLVFDVTQKDKTHKLNITIVGMTPEMDIDWATDEATPVHGRSTIDHDSFLNGRHIASELKSGNDKIRAPFLWIPLGLFSELNLGKTTYTEDDNPKMIGMVKVGKQKMDVTVDGEVKSVDVIHARSVSSGNNDEFWILNDANNPLIIKAVIADKSIQLSKIKL